MTQEPGGRLSEAVIWRCQACGEPIVTTEPIIKLVETRPVKIGERTTLAPGYTNNKRRHANGLAWYHYGAGSKELRIRGSAVVTCRCGTEFFVPGPSGRTGRYAEASSQSIAGVVQDDDLDAYLDSLDEPDHADPD